MTEYELGCTFAAVAILTMYGCWLQYARLAVQEPDRTERVQRMDTVLKLRIKR